MKERPILFSAPMVRAILDGRKTQTRRIVKERVSGPNPPNTLDFHDSKGKWVGAIKVGASEGNALALCPYGQRGDRLWVRETWTQNYNQLIAFRADGEDANDMSWRPSIFMPRWASRITLEVTGVRVERLQAISEADAVAEGIEKNHNSYFWGGPHEDGGRKQHADPRLSYRDLWHQINAKRAPWASNPYVWVVEFKTVPQ